MAGRRGAGCPVVFCKTRVCQINRRGHSVPNRNIIFVNPPHRLGCLPSEAVQEGFCEEPRNKSLSEGAKAGGGEKCSYEEFKEKSVAKRKVSSAKKAPSATTRKKAASKVTAAPKARTWNVMIRAWKTGKKLPVAQGSVFWETSVAKDYGESALLMSLAADARVYEEHIKNKKSPVSFMSKGNPPTLLVVPHDSGKNFQRAHRSFNVLLA